MTSMLLRNSRIKTMILKFSNIYLKSRIFSKFLDKLYKIINIWLHKKNLIFPNPIRLDLYSGYEIFHNYNMNKTVSITKGYVF